MSVRVCHVERGDRGITLRGLRLIGAASDGRWSSDPSDNGASFAKGASWVRAGLQSARSTDALEYICLDCSGVSSTWITTPSNDVDVIAMIARQGPGGDVPVSGGPISAGQVPSAGGHVDFFAASPMDSSVEPFAPAIDRGDGASRRAGVLLAADLPARLLLDALDKEGVRVGNVGTLWHAMALAWDAPSQSGNEKKSGQPGEGVVATSESIVGIVLVEPGREDAPGRLHWAWSRGSNLVAGGSMRLAPTGVRESDIARLTTEWLSWTLQVSEGPQRVVLIMPEPGTSEPEARESGGPDDAEAALARGLSPGKVGEQIVSRWPGCAVDAVAHEDPVGATLHRLVGVLERTPREMTREGARALQALSHRPGRPHRRMHQWAAGAVGALALGLTAYGFIVRREVPAIRDATKSWSEAWQPVVAQAWPQANEPRLGDPLKALQAEVDKFTTTAALPAKAQRARPVTQEVETLSLVLASPRVELTELRVDSTTGVRITAVVGSTSDAEQLLESLRRVGGSRVEVWTMDMQTSSQSGEKRIAVYDGKWAKEGA